MCERIIDRNKMKISAKRNITSTISYHRQSSLWFRIHLWWKYIFSIRKQTEHSIEPECHRTVCDVLKCTSTIANNNNRSNSSICHYQLEAFPLRSDCEPVHWCIVSNICEVGGEKRREWETPSRQPKVNTYAHAIGVALELCLSDVGSVYVSPLYSLLQTTQRRCTISSIDSCVLFYWRKVCSHPVTQHACSQAAHTILSVSHYSTEERRIKYIYTQSVSVRARALPLIHISNHSVSYCYCRRRWRRRLRIFFVFSRFELLGATIFTLLT